jgi:hypothetical protein
VVSLVSLFTDESKGYGIAGLIISGIPCSLYALAFLSAMAR